jgi:hypothetical protein
MPSNANHKYYSYPLVPPLSVYRPPQSRWIGINILYINGWKYLIVCRRILMFSKIRLHTIRYFHPFIYSMFI